MLIQKIHTAPCRLQVFLIRLDGIEHRREHPPRPPLKPDTFVAVDHTTVAIQASHDATMLPIQAVVQPKWHHVVDQRPVIKLLEFVSAFRVLKVGHL
jgi:hypothetical protein